MMTTAKPSARITSYLFTTWTNNAEQSLFSLLLGFENKAFAIMNEQDAKGFHLTDALFQLTTSIRMDDYKSLLGKEVPGFSTYERNVIIAGQNFNDELFLSHESGPPIEKILEEREAIDEDKEQTDPKQGIESKKVVFLYNSHNRESFLPHLPKETIADHAYHREVNITKVSKYLANRLEEKGIGTSVDETDIMNILHEKGWSYWQSYQASRPVVEAAMKQQKDLQYIFDIHRDSLPYKKTTKEINGTPYARMLFVIGAENKKYEKNLALATTLHYLIEDKYPGLSKGVVTKEGPNSNGVYNQDLLENSLLIEVGGYENKLEELYRTMDVFADVFYSHYLDAEPVNK